jgi:uncharacterized protein
MKRHPVLAYLALTFAISWGGIFAVAGRDGIPLPVTADPLQASPLLYIVMLAGPAIAGIAMTGVVHGRAGYRDLLDRLLAWRVGARWYGVALLTAPLLTAAIAILLAASFRSSDLLPAIITAENRTALLLSTIGLGLIVGLFEELGWTGFAAPHCGAVTAFWRRASCWAWCGVRGISCSSGRATASRVPSRSCCCSSSCSAFSSPTGC